MNCLFMVLAAIALSNPQRDWLSRHGKIVFAADTGYPPYTFADADKQPRGLDVDVAHAVGRALGVAVEIRPVQWDDMLPAMREGRADVLAGLVQTPERRDVW